MQSYCLEWYKSLEQKQALLDAAIDTYDGNCITTVLLFIRKTLNPRECLDILCNFTALQHQEGWILHVHVHVGIYMNAR